MNKKQIIKVVIFLLILAALTSGAGKVLIAKWQAPCYESVVQKEFYNLKENSVDVFFLGTSQITEAIAVPQLYNEYGISGYTIGSSSQPLQASYMWLKEACKTQDMEVVVLDVSRLYQSSATSWYHKGLDTMKLSVDKIRDMWDYCSTHEEADPLLSYLLPIYMYHSRWSELTEADFNLMGQNNREFLGFFARANNMKIGLEELAYEYEEPKPKTKMIDYQFEYLEKLVAYCKENEQKLLLIKTPKSDWSMEKHGQVKTYADANEIPFIDFSSEVMLREIGLDGSVDMGDEEHLNVLGAEKLTSWLGGYLKEHYDLTDHRGTEHGEILQEEYEIYERYAGFGRAKLKNDLASFFTCLDNDRYEILIQLNSPDAGLLNAELTQYMQSLGLTVDMQALEGLRYLAWIQNGEVKYEGTDKKAFEFADEFADGKGFRIYGDFYTAESAKMRVDFEDVIFSKRGLNILVYDSQENRVANTHTVYTNTSGELKLN